MSRGSLAALARPCPRGPTPPPTALQSVHALLSHLLFAPYGSPPAADLNTYHGFVKEALGRHMSKLRPLIVQLRQAASSELFFWPWGKKERIRP